MKHLLKLSFLLLALLLPALASAYDFEVDGIYYNISGSTATVTYQNNYSNYIYVSDYSGGVTIPATVTYNDITYSVTSIGYAAFYGCGELTSVTIPNSVTTIGRYSFYGCSGLMSVTIPNSVTTIGNDAFSGCSGLTSVTIPNSVTSIGESAFYGCSSLTSVTIPNSVTSIGNKAFQGCTELDTLNFNAVSCAGFSPTENYRPFYNLNISTINIGDIVETIPSYFACGLTKLINVNIPNSVTSIGRYSFYGCRGLTGELVIPNSVKAINYATFENCSGLTNITIPNSVTSIHDNVFSGCTGLTNVTIGNSVVSIGDYAFRGCSGLTSVTIPNSATSIGDYAYYSCSGLTSVTIGNSVISIGDYAFQGCSGLTSVTIPNSVTNIGSSAFRNCRGLTSVTIGNSVTSIGESVFRACSGLASVTIPNSVTSIGNYAFQGCSALDTLNFNAISCADFSSTASYRPFYYLNISTINIGDEVDRIPTYFGYGLSKLTGVTCMATTPPEMATIDCFSTYSKTSLYVPRGTYDAYNSTDYWHKFYNIYEFDENGNILVTSLLIDETEQIMNIGETLLLNATVLPDIATNRVVIWSSSDNGVATVDSNGMVMAVGVGTTTITATTTDGTNLYARCSVTVVRQVTGITLNASSLDLVLPETAQLVATILPGDATNGTLRWTSSKTSVATVDDSGLVKSVAPGTATITVTTTDGTNLSASCAVTVTRQYVTGITLSASNLTLCLGDTYQLLADVAPDNASNKGLNWSSSSTSVACVDNDGLVTAKAVGTATITAKAADGSGKSANCIVTVMPDNYMAIDTLTHIRGEAAELVELPLNLINRDAISAIQFDVSLPSCASLGFPEVILNDARVTLSHTVSINKLSTNNYRVLIASSQAKNLVGNDGPIGYLNLLLNKSVTTTGNYYVTVSNIIAAGADETRYALSTVRGIIRYYYIVGDVNADVSVDIADYMATASKILTRTPSPFYSDAADVDLNSSINVTDLVGITNIALGIKPITLRYAPPRDTAWDRLTASGLALTADGRGEVILDLDADFDFAAFQMDMALPQGMALIGVEFGQGVYKLQPVWETMSDGTVRLIASSFSDADCSGDCPGLLTLKLRNDGSYSGQGTLRIHDITFADRHLISHNLDDVVVNCNGASSISEVCGEVRIYAEDGKFIVETPEGGIVRVSDIAGHVREYPVTAGRNVFTPWAEGILIISFDSQTIKIKI